MRISSAAPRIFGAVALSSLVLAGPSGCAPEAGLPPGGTPVVSPDSDQAKKAIEEREEMIRLRQEQEAKARRKAPGLPAEG